VPAPVAGAARARADRYTVAGSVACSATIASAASVTEAAGTDSRCLAASLARRCATLTVTVIAGSFR